MNRQQYLDQWRKWHGSYERRSFRIFRRAIKQCYDAIPVEGLDYNNYRVLIEINVLPNPIYSAYVEVYTTIGLIHGNRVGQGINRDIKDYSRPLFSEEFQRTILEWVRENCGLRITSVIDTIREKVISLVEQAIEQNLTIEQMQAFLRRTIADPKFTRYQALRISRTETTTAANHAAMVSGETSGIVLVKEWISTLSDRTRRKPRDQFDHLHMNGQQVEMNEKFVLRSRDGVVDQMEYPGDPAGSAGDIIQCRCAMALVPKRDANGMVIRRAT